MVHTRPISETLPKRSTDGNANTGLTTGETAGLVVGIIGVVIAALTALKGLKCWKSRKMVLVSLTITNGILMD